MTAVRIKVQLRAVYYYENKHPKKETIKHFIVEKGLDHNNVGTSRLNPLKSLGAIENCFDCLTPSLKENSIWEANATDILFIFSIWLLPPLL